MRAAASGWSRSIRMPISRRRICGNGSAAPSCRGSGCPSAKTSASRRRFRHSGPARSTCALCVNSPRRRWKRWRDMGDILGIILFALGVVIGLPTLIVVNLYSRIRGLRREVEDLHLRLRRLEAGHAPVAAPVVDAPPVVHAAPVIQEVPVVQEAIPIE